MIKARIYFCDLVGEPKPNGEIEEIDWIDSSNNILVDNIIKKLVPELKSNCLIR